MSSVVSVSPSDREVNCDGSKSSGVSKYRVTWSIFAVVIIIAVALFLVAFLTPGLSYSTQMSLAGVTLAMGITVLPIAIINFVVQKCFKGSCRLKEVSKSESMNQQYVDSGAI